MNISNYYNTIQYKQLINTRSLALFYSIFGRLQVGHLDIWGTFFFFASKWQHSEHHYFCQCWLLLTAQSLKLSETILTLLLYSFFISFSGGVAAEVGLQPAELLDDSVPEAPEHQTTDSAYAGAEGLPQASDGRHDQAISGVNLYVSGRRLAWRMSWSTCCVNCPLSTICPSWLITKSPQRLCAT